MILLLIRALMAPLKFLKEPVWGGLWIVYDTSQAFSFNPAAGILWHAVGLSAEAIRAEVGIQSWTVV